MRRRDIYIILIFIFFVVQFVLANFVINDFSPILSFALLVPFYIIISVYQTKFKVIRYIGYTMIFVLLSNIFLYYYLGTFGLSTIKIMLIGRLSYFGSIFAIIMAFVLLLQSHPRSKLLKASFVFITISNYLFQSYYFIPFGSLLARIFGPNPTDLVTLSIVLVVLRYITWGLIMLSQLIIIYKMDRESKFV